MNCSIVLAHFLKYFCSLFFSEFVTNTTLWIPFTNHFLIVVWIRQNQYIFEVFCCCPDHCWATDINLLYCFFKRTSRFYCFLKGIQVNNNDINLFITHWFQYICIFSTTSQYASMYFWMKCFYSSIHHFFMSCIFWDLYYIISNFFDCFICPPSRNDFYIFL